MVSVYNTPTKKALKSKIGLPADTVLMETSLHGPECKPGAKVYVVGPGPYERKWYATVTIGEDGRILKVF
jgi:hypothetical protein